VKTKGSLYNQCLKPLRTGRCRKLKASFTRAVNSEKNLSSSIELLQRPLFSLQETMSRKSEHLIGYVFVRSRHVCRGQRDYRLLFLSCRHHHLRLHGEIHLPQLSIQISTAPHFPSAPWCYRCRPPQIIEVTGPLLLKLPPPPRRRWPS
jgi:hypothetical protein